MPDFQSSSRWANLLTGRWQAPAALLALAVGGIALLNLAPKPPPRIELDTVLADLAKLETNGDVLGAATAIQDLLAVDARALDPETKRELHERLADLLYRNECRQSEHSAANIELLLASDDAARALGRAPTPETEARRALAALWLGRDETAVRRLVELVPAELSAETRENVLHGLIEAVGENHLPADETRELLESLLATGRLPPPFAWWAIRSAVDQALAAGDSAAAREVVELYGDELASSDLEGYGRHLEAAVAMAEGRVEDAYPGAWWVEAWIPYRPRVAEQLDRHASLPVLNRTLLGRAQLASGEPTAALESFNYVLALRPKGADRTAAILGKARALAALGRHDAAREALREGLDSFRPGDAARGPATDAARDALQELCAQRRAAGDAEHAINYLRDALELTPLDPANARRATLESLAATASEAADAASEGALARRYHRIAGEALAAVADLPGLDDDTRADRLWAAATHYDAAGELGEVLPLLGRFLDGRSSDPRAPQALLRLGQANEGLGRLNEALGWYEQLVRRHDDIDVSAAAQVRAARTLISLGPERFPEAEERLFELMNSGRVSPAAALYREALLTLGELLDAEGRYAAAIARFEEFQRLYPDDPRRLDVQMRAAHAYRRSAAALRQSSADGTPADAARREADARLAQAADAYAGVIEALRDEALRDEALRDESAAELERFALFYRADCLAELGTDENLKTAFGLYQAAATRLEGRPEALTAYVQMAAIQLRQGLRTDAARSLERAHWLLSALPDEAFAHDAARQRAAWERFFEVTLSSTLLRDALAAR